MAFNFYEGWSIQDLLAERLMLQKQRSTGRITEVRLANELTKTDGGDFTPIEVQLREIQTALNLLDPETYPLPVTSSVTLQNYR